MEQRTHRHVARGVTLGLASGYFARTPTPDHLHELVDRLRQSERACQGSATFSTHSDPNAHAQKLDMYLDRLGAHLPGWLSATIEWLRKPERLVVRAVVSLLLIVGGVLSFLPVLGLWMLPLGLIIISQDIVFLQRPLVSLFEWTERRWERWRSRR